MSRIQSGEAAHSTDPTPPPRPAYTGTEPCTDAPTDLFFETQPFDAMRICSTCPLVTACAEYATWSRVSGQYVQGVWGGTTARHRITARAQHRKAIA